MENYQLISKNRVSMAYVLAIAVDIVQIPSNFAFFVSLLTGVGIVAVDAPIETLDMAFDTLTAFVISSLLGFHWTLLPTFVLELVPGLDAAPTWTACTAYVVSLRKKQGRIDGGHSSSAAHQLSRR